MPYEIVCEQSNSGFESWIIKDAPEEYGTFKFVPVAAMLGTKMKSSLLDPIGSKPQKLLTDDAGSKG